MRTDNYRMFEEKEFITEIETALHETEHDELLYFMNSKINGAFSKMYDLKKNINSEFLEGNIKLDDHTEKSFYILSLFINLWICRN